MPKLLKVCVDGGVDSCARAWFFFWRGDKVEISPVGIENWMVFWSCASL